MRWQVWRMVACALAGVALCVQPALSEAAQEGQQKVLRYAFRVAETGFDPAQISDLYSRNVTTNIFDTLYRYDYLTNPSKVVPNLADGMPAISNDYRTYTIKVKKGIYFADDPAFKGTKREVVAEDLVYAFKRLADPKNKSPNATSLLEEKFIGLEELRKDAQKEGGKFDYDKVIDGIKTLDRYTLQFNLAETRPRFVHLLTDSSILGAQAREVVEFYGDKIMEHPVGTGAFMLKEWRRSSSIVLVRNPNYRDMVFDEQPTPGDKPMEAIAARLKGKKLPLLDRIEISIIEEDQPRWLAFLNGEQDLLDRLPASMAGIAIPNGKLAPNLAKKGIQMDRQLESVIAYSFFNMDDPLVGGMSPEKVALRRAISLAYNADEEIRMPRRGEAIRANSQIQPNTYGFDPNYRTDMSTYDPARAKALLDMYGYVDKNGDGWRDLPDGSPLVLEYSTSPDAFSKELNEVWKRNMSAVGIKIVFKQAKWPENLKAARAGKLMMWGLGMSPSVPDGGESMNMGFSKSIGNGSNYARFRHAKFDELYQQQATMPDGPERIAVLREMVKILVAYAPYKFQVHRYLTDMVQPWVVGYRHMPIGKDFWKFIDIDLSKAPHGR